MSSEKTRVMPAGAAEAMLGRGLWWALWVVNVALTIGATVLAVGVAVSGGVRTPVLVVLALVAVMWWALVGLLFVLVLYRPGRIPVDTVTADVVILGNRRVPAWQLVMLAAVTALLAAGAVATTDGWRIVLLIVAVACLAGAVSLAFRLRHRPRLVLTPQRMRAVTAHGDARLDWNDIALVTYAQGSGGLMVARVDVAPGATSFVARSRRRRVDVAPLTLDLDPLLLVLALRLYWLAPASRAELGTGRAPARLFDGGVATASTPAEISEGLLSAFRPR
ncbi:hypothetical protein ET475_07030 [Microbacterium protaetiae]|uniref:PH domain-containing protein n=1 Tax=Microbacterium protaetiae TaxID=2509458 RepID=A0A4P6EDH3_9MICO|nr:hypothetical protein [Microbacterium protaetiae]QAY59766.1 hypothetical protein ET475_07030 [Microbacterium protaetiae]